MDKEINLNALGQRVKEYRMQKGYSAEKLSEIAGVSKSHINNIESANSRASAEVLVRIANALDISVDVLLCDSLKESQKARMTEYTKILENCNEKETKIIVDTVKTLKESLRGADI
ncbi:MAG: helix-turn-helix domain-containing protein [Roseburia sp.]|nr:helix-turn-helix domain-containing protein [Roseburia sp.]